MGFGNKQPWSGVSALSHNGSVVLRKLLILPGLIFLIDITMAPEAHSSASCPYNLTHLNENRKISKEVLKHKIHSTFIDFPFQFVLEF